MKIIFITAGIILCLFLASVYAQSGSSDEGEITQKLDQLLQNQERMLDYLKFIKNKSA